MLFRPKALLLLLSSCWILRPSDACSCFGPITLEGSYEDDPSIMTVYIGSERECPDDGLNNVCYDAYLYRVNKGCDPAASQFLVRTSRTSCEVYLQQGNYYVLSGSLDEDGNLIPGACSYNTLWQDMSYGDWLFLWFLPSPVCPPSGGGGTCPDGSDPVQCVDDPCNNAVECNDPEAKCVPDYCGGCNYNFFIDPDQVWPVCQPCGAGNKCPTHYYCSNANQCLRGCTCSDDDDCTNEYNTCAYPLCVGPIKCSNNVCVKSCH